MKRYLEMDSFTGFQLHEFFEDPVLCKNRGFEEESQMSRPSLRQAQGKLAQDDKKWMAQIGV